MVKLPYLIFQILFEFMSEIFVCVTVGRHDQTMPISGEKKQFLLLFF